MKINDSLSTGENLPLLQEMRIYRNRKYVRTKEILDALRRQTRAIKILIYGAIDHKIFRVISAWVTGIIENSHTSYSAMTVTNSDDSDANYHQPSDLI